jgi:hypothetical protein
MSLSTFQALIAELGQSLGEAGFSAGDDGYVGLKIDAIDIHIQYETEGDAVVLFTRLQEIEPDRRDALYSMLLAANLFWSGTRGATFSADFNTGRVFLADRRPRAALDLEALTGWIEQFADVAGYWHDRIDAASEGGPLVDGMAPVDAGDRPGDGLRV